MKFYYKEKVIGSGTFGKVWLVKSKINCMSFVMKEVDLSSMNSTETQQALTEVTVLSRCRHRHIIKYKDAIIDHKSCMLSIIMEYADGGDLYSEIIKQRGVPFKEHNVITWFTQICLALQYIHHKSILHRDLKTRNIFLTRDKQIKIGDFGIARCLTETKELATTAIGTPYYLSPEICNRQPYNHKSDMWAVGCILFEMAAMAHPFQALNFAHLLTLIVTGKRKELPSHCSSLIRDLVEKLLDDNPDTRLSADEILALPALQPYLTKLWITQNSDIPTALPKLFNQKENARRLSLCDFDRDSTGSIPKRRASISAVESRGIRTRFGFVSKPKNQQESKLATSSKPHSLKLYKNSPKRLSLKKDQCLTYRVLKPLTLKERLSNIVCNTLKIPRTDTEETNHGVYRQKKHDESDCGYQSEEHVKRFSDKAIDFVFATSTNPPKTSTRNSIDVSNFQVDDALVNDVFGNNTNEKGEISNFFESASKDIHPGCTHSQCQQCMLDILWKNRIRGTIGPLVKRNEESELIRKLRAVFSGDMFDTVYHTLISNWENENADIPVSLREFTDSMNFSQLQHLPLMMQLIQLDLIPK